jgi:hypothetical protein
MKHPSLLVLLLGFGFLAPFACSKSKQPRDKKQAQEQPATESSQQSKLALFGPVVKVVAASASKA